MSNELPGVAAEIEALIGLDLTVKLLKARGGTDIEIPARADGSKLAGIIGVKATDALIRDLGRGRITLPCAFMRGQGARRHDAREMLRAGKSVREVALACDMHQRTVARIKADLDAADADARQGRLPL
ncbi:hypothetical protein [Maritimibacter sp. HL-12]|uniref:hypothetical protein n=1 Tax=Maritimibacter sp. HL-12 TaxID=1162418 RepID=UPI000A0F0F0C|nr:hypothetical protein [Maritimibacter sp. HL-12]SMH35976.1 hypothetical protein SAMN05661107_0669 [Maritimibacter sp. HL-12]